ncbi:MAG TPA: DUF1572 family protein [Thermoanaerobaculia bacterium]|nr:DUF1572 family protein [Thermoanaerobaculia bacterium]
MSETAASFYLREVAARARSLKDLADKALAQVRDEDLAVALDPESNSLAALILHLGGNLRSRWTDFLTTDGEKPDRNRDAEFEPDASASREVLLARWEDGWGSLLATLSALSEEDLTRTVTIRAEPHNVVQAIERGVTHAAYHVGQIVFLAKHLAGGGWKTLSVPRGGTRAFNEKMFGKK